MTAADAPVLIAYDGSDTARHAVREAARLLGSREVLVVTIWEPALAAALQRAFGTSGVPGPA